MKQSRRNIRNAVARAERLSEGPPRMSKYARKSRAVYDTNDRYIGQSTTPGVINTEPTDGQ